MVLAWYLYLIEEVGKEKKKVSKNFKKWFADLWGVSLMIDRYPKTASGKIQKFKLRDMGMEMLRREQGDR